MRMTAKAGHRATWSTRRPWEKWSGGRGSGKGRSRFPVLWVQTSTIEEIIATLRELAQWSPQPEKAQQAAQAMQQEYDALKAEIETLQTEMYPAKERQHHSSK